MAEDGALQFYHEPLPDNNAIRLLKREPSDSDGPPAFSLHIRNLEEPFPAYHCLSYTWGNPFAHGVPFREEFLLKDPEYGLSSLAPILVNGKALRIHKNLYDALTVVPKSAYVNDLNRQTADRGQSYLHYVATRGWKESLELYITRRADVNTVDDEGRTPLHCAAEAGHLDCVKVLCEAAAVRRLKEEGGMTARDVAAEAGRDEVVEYLDALATELDPMPCQTEEFDDNGADYLWADAICINQADIDEKSMQVSMMDKIYSLATHVIAWLGPEDKFSENGIRTMKLLTKHLKPFGESQIAPYAAYNKDNYGNCGVPEVSDKDWEALASIFQRQWFRRVWIVQEAVLSGTLIMYLGDQLVPWYDLGKLAEAIRRQEAKLGSTRSTSFEPVDGVGVPVEWNMAEMFKWRSNITMTGRGDEATAQAYRDLFVLDHLVGCFWTFKASDPRDKIFSLYGLLNRFANTRYDSDYRRSISSVYTKATRQIIAEAGQLEILSRCVSSVEKMDGLPSWVPDYSLGASNAVPDFFTADKGLKDEWSGKDTPVDENPRLASRGLRLGRISKANGRIATGPFAKFLFDPGWLKLVLSLKTEGNQPLSEILWRTLCMDLTYGSFFDHEKYGDRAPAEFGQQFMMFMMLMVLSGADRKTLENNNIEPAAIPQVSIVDAAYDPFEEDMVGVLDDLDAIAAHDGDKNVLPLRSEVVSYWNNLTCSLVRSTLEDENGGPYEFNVPPDVTDGKSRCVGSGHVLTGSRMFKRCLGFATAYQIAYGWRQLFTLEEEYLGLAPLSAKEGDEVWILAGLHAPAILRGNGGGFEFVGSCYVHGLMRGEAVGIARAKGAELKDIELI